MAHLVKYVFTGFALYGNCGWKRNSSRLQAFLFFHEKVFQLRLKSINIDYVIESTGKYTYDEQLNTCWCQESDSFSPFWARFHKTVVLGVNDDILDGPKPLYRMQVAQRIMLHLWWKWLMNLWYRTSLYYNDSFLHYRQSLHRSTAQRFT
jgi:hypothetical protein